MHRKSFCPKRMKEHPVSKSLLYRHSGQGREEPPSAVSHEKYILRCFPPVSKYLRYLCSSFTLLSVSLLSAHYYPLIAPEQSHSLLCSIYLNRSHSLSDHHSLSISKYIIFSVQNAVHNHLDPVCPWLGCPAGCSYCTWL